MLVGCITPVEHERVPALVPVKRQSDKSFVAQSTKDFLDRILTAVGKD